MDDPTMLSWLHIGRNIAAALVAIGVAGEFFIGFVEAPIIKRLDDTRQAEIARLNKESSEIKRDSADALLKIAQANERAASAEQKAAESNRIAEQEKIERLRLEASLTPRRLTGAQKDQLTALLKPYSPSPIDLEWSSGGGQEAVDLVNDMDAAIRAAHIPIPNRMILGDQFFRGIFLRAGVDRRNEAEAISRFLVENNLATRPVHVIQNPDNTLLSIVVGSKP